MEDHAWHLKSWDHNGVGILKLYCGECSVDFGGRSGDHTKAMIHNLFNNFKNSHIMSERHIRAWCKNKGVWYKDHPMSEPSVKGKGLIMSPEDHNRAILEGLAIMEAANAEVGLSKEPFKVLGDPIVQGLRSFYVKVKCNYCEEPLNLCPSKKNLMSSLKNHLASSKYIACMEKVRGRASAGSAISSGKRGRPSRSSGSTGNTSQRDLHNFFAGSRGEPGELLCLDKSKISLSICWGFRGPSCTYGGAKYSVKSLLADPHSGVEWYTEPHLVGLVPVGSNVIMIDSAFRARDCNRFVVSGEPFPALTCYNCAKIPNMNDFRKQVTREHIRVEKRGGRGTGGGRRLGYLSVIELAAHGRILSKQLGDEHVYHGAAKARIV